MAARQNVKIEGVDELRKVFKQAAPKALYNATRAAVHELAGKVRDEMKKRVAKRSRALAKSIKTKRRNPRGHWSSGAAFRSEVRMGSTAPYGFMLEFGTRNTKAQPFIVPSVETWRARQTGFFREEVGRKLEKSLRRKGKGR